MTADIITDERYNLEIIEETSLVVKLAGVIAVTALNGSSHDHDNKAVLDQFGEANGQPTYNGLDIVGQPGADGSDGYTPVKGVDYFDGATGPQGEPGPAGADGSDGQGVPAGGITGQVLAKNSTTDFDTVWIVPTGEGGVTDHGLLTGLADDDHSQYLNETRHDALDHTGLTGILALGTTSATAAYGDHNHTGVYQPVGTYSTDIHSNITALNAVSGTNTGDQDLSGYSLTTHNHSLNNLTEKSYNSLTDKPSIPSISGLLDETAHDALDHTGLIGIPAAYSLPTASTTVLGGVKVDGITVTITDGVISSSGSGMTNPMTDAGDIIIGGTSGAQTRLAKGTDGQVLTVVAGIPAYADASGGSATIDWTSPVVVTDTANLTYGKHYIVAVTAADKTLTLPEITAVDYGKMIVVEIAAATTKLITIDGYATQAIDGAAIRIMWASEVAQLIATSNGWTKVGGKSTPTFASMIKTSNQTFAVITSTLLTTDTVYGSLDVMVGTPNTLLAVRPAVYTITGYVGYNNNNSRASFNQVRVFKNGVFDNNTVLYMPASLYTRVTLTYTTKLSSNDALTLYAFYSTGSYRTTVTQPTASGLLLLENPSW